MNNTAAIIKWVEAIETVKLFFLFPPSLAKRG